jgi:ribosomal protein L11 methyltransferase
MPFLQLTVAIGSADPEPFEAALLAAGASSITLEDAADDPVLEPEPGTTPLWPTVRVKALFDASVDRDAILLAMSQQLPSPLPGIRFEDVEDRAWEREWLKDFRPMRFGARLWVCPAGMRPEPADIESVFIDLDPGLAFGTGTHPTTALCLEWLESTQLEGKTVVDYGCGSGVLAIAALKLGAKAAVAVDIDPQAIVATNENAQRNAVKDRLTACTVEAFHRNACDVVVANILAEPLEQLAPRLSQLVVPGGAIVLSGLLQAQAPRLASIYGAWFDMDPMATRDDWARLSGIKRAGQDARMLRRAGAQVPRAQERRSGRPHGCTETAR